MLFITLYLSEKMTLLNTFRKRTNKTIFCKTSSTEHMLLTKHRCGLCKMNLNIYFLPDLCTMYEKGYKNVDQVNLI